MDINNIKLSLKEGSKVENAYANEVYTLFPIVLKGVNSEEEIYTDMGESADTDLKIVEWDNHILKVQNREGEVSEYTYLQASVSDKLYLSALANNTECYVGTDGSYDIELKGIDIIEHFEIVGVE